MKLSSIWVKSRPLSSPGANMIRAFFSAIQYCLREARLTASEIRYVAFYEKSMVKGERLLETYLAYAPDGFETFREAMSLWARLKLHLPDRIREEQRKRSERKSSR